MLWYSIKRILLVVPTFLGITLVTFAVIHLAPGDPAAGGVATGSGTEVSPDAYTRLRAQYRLDEPLAKQYTDWLTDLAHLDMGRSFHDGRPVWEKIAPRLGPTLLLTGTALVLSLVISIPLGVFVSLRAGGLLDRLVGLLCFGAYASPRYVVGMVLIVAVGVRFDWLPFVGMTSVDYADLSTVGKVLDVLRHSLPIGICFTYPLVAYEVRFIRANMIAALGEGYILAARARGASMRHVAIRHALPNVLLPLLTLIGLMLPGVIGGSVILEAIFSWPGMGRLLFEAIGQRDYPVVMALSVLSALVVLVGTLIVDLLYAAADPRVRYTR